MKKNMGSSDKIIRMALVALIAVLYLTNIISGTLAVVLEVFAVAFLITTAISFCPLYSVFGVSTRKKE